MINYPEVINNLRTLHTIKHGGSDFLSSLSGEPKRKFAAMVNSVFSEYKMDKPTRLLLLSRLLGRKITSSNQITIQEAILIYQLVYEGSEDHIVCADFDEWINGEFYKWI